ncbi:unnamed protein product [Rhodiola kirilowii]
MEISSNLKLCLLLVSSAIRRCWQRLCRLSVNVNRSSSTSSGYVFRISVSDTGIGSSVDDFKSLKCTQSFAAENYSGDANGADCIKNWKGRFALGKGGFLVSWKEVCKAKAEGGLGLKNLSIMNEAMRLNQLWEMRNEVDSVWKAWTRAYWTKGRDWWEVENASKTTWIIKDLEVCKTLSEKCITFHQNRMHWMGTGIGFTVSHTYNTLTRHTENTDWHKLVWNRFNSPRSSFHLWLVAKNKLLTRDRLNNMGSMVDSSCVLCGRIAESRDRLFFHCQFSKEVVEATAQFLKVRGMPAIWHLLIPWFNTLNANALRTRMMAPAISMAAYEIWIAGNSKFFKDEAPSVPKTLKKFFGYLRMKIGALNITNITFEDRRWIDSVGGSVSFLLLQVVPCIDGVLSIATTNISDNEIKNYQIYLKEVVSARRVTVLPIQPKNGARFSGTEVSFSTVQNISDFLPEILCFLKKMLILGIPVFSVQFQKDSIDVMVQNYIGPIYENPVVEPVASTIELLKSGFGDYVLKHGNKSDTKCMSCFSDQRCEDLLKVGTGMVYCIEGQRNAGLVVEAVIIICDSNDLSSPCFRDFGANTEVVLFYDFSPSLLTQMSLKVLTKLDWKSYGLTLGNVLDIDGHVLLEWENLQPNVHIDIALHCHQSLYPLVYHAMMPSPTKASQFDHVKHLKKALRHALENIKEQHSGILLSANALKVCSYSPDLSKTIAGLILSSDDADFQGECMKLLGLHSQDQTNEKESVEACLNEKIIKVISLNDKKSCRGKEPAPLLFEDEVEADNYPDEEFE